MDGFTPFTNYTAFVLQNNTKGSGPIFFMTKSVLFSVYQLFFLLFLILLLLLSASFTFPLIHSLPFCPGSAIVLFRAQPSIFRWLHCSSCSSHCYRPPRISPNQCKQRTHRYFCAAPLLPQQTSGPHRNPALSALGSPCNMLLLCPETWNAE